MKFNDKILQLRDERKMSQEELSRASGISVRTIQRIEKGEVSPRGFTTRKLLEGLKVSLEEFNSETNNNSNFNIEENAKLNRFIMSNFLVFIFPLVFILYLRIIWKKGEWSFTANQICKKVLSFQILWAILNIVIISTTPFFINLFGGQYVIGRLFPTPILVYLGLSFINVFIVIRIAKSYKRLSSNWTSRIPNLF